MSAQPSKKARSKKNKRAVAPKPLAWNQALFWGALCALSLASLRIVVLSVFAVSSVSGETLALSLARTPAHTFVFALLGLLTFGPRRTAWLGWVLLAVFGAACIGAFHYEASFGELPGLYVLRHIDHLDAVRSSAEQQAPLAALIVESVAFAGAAIISFRLVRRHKVGTGRPALIGKTGTVLTGLLFLIAHLRPSPLSGPLAIAAQDPLVYFALSNGAPADALPATPEEDSSAVYSVATSPQAFQIGLGHRPPFASLRSDGIVCGDRSGEEHGKPNRRNVILFSLEGIGRAEIEQKREGEYLMPHLAKLSRDAFASRNFFAAGSQSAQALPALFAGIPAQSYRILLWRKPLPRVQGLPQHLVERGYSTSYFHGGDLSFEQQRPFLKSVGFQTISELEPTENTQLQGWGDSDDVVLARMKAHLQTLDAKGERRFFSAFSSLSTHHPFTLPPSWPRQFKSTHPDSAFHESLRFADHHVHEFVRWFRESDLAKTTYLIITGDHAPLGVNTAAQQTGAPLRYDVPLIVLSPDPEEQRDLESFEERLGGHGDLPRTITSLLGVEPMACDQGVDLYQATNWPQDRMIYAAGGRNLGELHVRSDGAVGRYIRSTSTLELLSEHPPDEQPRWRQRFETFLKHSMFVSHYADTHDAYAPPNKASVAQRERRSSIPPRAEPPRMVSHRGNQNGLDNIGYSNRRAAIVDAIGAGFAWIEIDVNLLKDGQLALAHDHVIAQADGTELHLTDLTLEQLRALPTKENTTTLEAVLDEFGSRVNFSIEAKMPEETHNRQALAHRIATVVAERLAAGTIKEVVVDSFSLQTAASIKEHCGCPVAWDLPYLETVTEQLLETAADSDFDWIFVHQHVATPQAIQAAHERGLRVMAYPVNDEERLRAFGAVWPDALITDRSDFLTIVPQVFSEVAGPHATR